MSEIPIGADVVEAAAKAAGEMYWNQHNPPGHIGNFKLWEKVAEAAIREALDKLGLREEREERGEAVIDSTGALNWIKARFVSDWRPVGVEAPERSMPPERRAEYQRRIRAASERHPMPHLHIGVRVDTEPGERLRAVDRLRGLVERLERETGLAYLDNDEQVQVEGRLLHSLQQAIRKITGPSATSEGER